MFGYVIINKPEIKFREFDCYRSYYCGLCQTLKKDYKRAGQITVSYDMTFLTMLLTSLYEPEDTLSDCRCIAHPLEKHPTRTNEYTEYAAAMNILLAYYKSLDDWSDERKITKLLFSKRLYSRYSKILKKYPEKAKAIHTGLENIHNCEKAGDTDIDKVSGYFGKIMAELFVYKEDEWAETLRTMGFFLGKFIYLMDAYDDIEKDIKTGNYNPLRPMWEENQEGFDEYTYNVLTMMISECSKAFETLPILENASILRNILYSGVWTKYEITKNQRNNKEKRDAK